MDRLPDPPPPPVPSLGEAGAEAIPPAFMRGAEMPVWLIIMLGALSAIGPLSTDMYLPAFPALERSFGSGSGSAQVTLAAWFAGLAVGQFSQGPASDRWGRRAPLVFGLVVYTLGSVGCMAAADVWTFSACRFLAALGGSAGMVIPRAIVRDVSVGNQGARIMSQLMLVLGVVPILAPTLGGLVLSVADWRWIFAIATLYGVVAAISVLLFLPDTLPRSSRLHLSPTQVLGRYYEIARERVFLSNSCICGFATFVVFAYLAGTPVVFERILHFSPTGFGAMFGINAFFYILGTQVNARVVTRVGAVRMMTGGLYSLTAGACALALAAISGFAGPHGPLLATVLPVMWVMGSLGFVSPNATILALGAHARHAGSASAMLGTIQFTLGAISGLVMGVFAAVSVRPMAFVILAGVAGAAIADLARKAATDRAGLAP